MFLILLLLISLSGREISAHQGHSGQLAHPEQLLHPVHPEHIKHPEHLAHPEFLVHPEYQARSVHSKHQEEPEHLAHSEHLEHQGRPVHSKHPEQSEHLAHPDHSEHQAHSVHSKHQEHQAQSVNLSYSERPVHQERTAHPELSEHPEHPERPERPERQKGPEHSDYPWHLEDNLEHPWPAERHESPDYSKLKSLNISIDNYTSCEQFVANTTFDPQTIVDIDWKIFYLWNPNYEDGYNIKFSLASKVLVDRFRVELDSELKPPVNWSNAVMFMETSIDFSALFIKTNVSGIFLIIPSLAFEYNKVPQLLFGMKVVEPGYLGIENCDLRFCYALAPIGKIPEHRLLEKEAQKLGFWNNFGRSYIHIVSELPTPLTEDFNMDDDDEDEHLEMVHNDDMQFL